MRSVRASHNMIAVSAYQMESAINVFQDLDLSLLASLSDIISTDPRRETNKDEMTGKEEADTIYDLGQTSGLSLTFDKAQPQHFAFLYGYALGIVNSTAAGAGWLKTIKPMDLDLDRGRSLPSFTAAMRYGKEIARERYASMFVDGVTSTFAKDSFVKIAGQIKGTGKAESSITEEIISETEDATALTLASAVNGTTAAERMDSIHQVRVELTSGVWTEVDFTAVSDADPGVITITAPGAGVETKTYKVLYAPAAAAWMTFPERISETPLRVSEIKFVVGGAWNGSEFVGGREMGPEINSIEHKLQNNGKIEFVPGSDGAYASGYFREGRSQTLGLDREFRDYVLRNLMQKNETFGVSILAEGMEYESGHKYMVELILPMLGVLSAPLSVNGKRLGEKGDLAVLKHETYGSIVVNVKNKQQNYAS